MCMPGAMYTYARLGPEAAWVSLREGVCRGCWLAVPDCMAVKGMSHVV